MAVLLLPKSCHFLPWQRNTSAIGLTQNRKPLIGYRKNLLFPFGMYFALIYPNGEKKRNKVSVKSRL